MSAQNVETTNTTLDTVLVSVAVVVAFAGLMAFTFLTDYSLSMRLAMLAGGLLVAVGIGAMSASGKRFFLYGRDSFEELRRVVWPTRKETVTTTGMVMAFVVAVAFYLFIIDKIIEFGLYDGLLKLTF